MGSKEEVSSLYSVSFYSCYVCISLSSFSYVGWFCVCSLCCCSQRQHSNIGNIYCIKPNKKWWVLWIFIGGVFIATHSYSWLFLILLGQLTLQVILLEMEYPTVMSVMEDCLLKVLKMLHRVFISCKLQLLYFY